MTSIARPSRRLRASATAMRYWGLRILPSRVSLILTAMVKRVLLLVSRCNSAMRAGLPDPVLPRVSDHRTTSAHQPRRWVDSRPLCQSDRGQRKSRHARYMRQLRQRMLAMVAEQLGHPHGLLSPVIAGALNRGNGRAIADAVAAADVQPGATVADI